MLPSRQRANFISLQGCFVVAWLLLRWSAAHNCDEACQLEQHEALLDFYNSLEGPAWRNSSGWTQPFARSSTGLPSFCSWFGVLCCSEEGLVTFNVAFTNPTKLACLDPGAVLGLSMASNNLRGSLPASETVWAALDDLIYLQLSGLHLHAL